jgi:hypothetical protein
MPTFEADPALEFEFFLADKLGGMTVEEMRQRMSNGEFVRWMVYHGRRVQDAEIRGR